MNLSVKEVDLKETLELLAGRHGLQPPYPERTEPPWLPPDHPLVQACTSQL